MANLVCIVYICLVFVPTSPALYFSSIFLCICRLKAAMSTQPNSGGAARKQHRGRKPYPISLKLDIIEKYDSGMKMSDIAKVAGIANSTVTTTVRDRNLIKAAAAKELTGGKPSKTPSKTSRLLAEMERLLDRWIHDMKEQDKPPSFTQIQEKAFSILRAIEKRTGTRIKTFTASADWYKEFKKRLGLDHRKRMAEVFQSNLRKIIEKGDYLPEQIFNVAKTDLFWRRMPAQKDSNEDEIRIPGLLGEEDRILLSFGGNVSGDCKLKPLAVYHASKPGAIKGKSSENSVIWRYNRRVKMTDTICTDWYINHFIPDVKNYCKEKDIPFKIILVMSSAREHPQSLDYYHPDVKVLYFYPQSAPAIQPMSQGIHQAFKALYYQLSYEQARKAVQKEDGTTFCGFWKSYNILDCIDNVITAWDKITSKCMNVAWHKLCPQFVSDFEGLTEMKEAERKCKEIVDVVEVAISKEIVETCAEVKTRDDEFPVEDTNVEEEEPKQGEPTDRHAL